MNTNQQSTCTWCHGKGYIKKKYDFDKTQKIRWLLVIGLVLIAVLARQFDILRGVWALSFIGAILFLLVVQFGLDFLDSIGLLFKQKVACPHCSGRQ